MAAECATVLLTDDARRAFQVNYAMRVRPRLFDRRNGRSRAIAKIRAKQAKGNLTQNKIRNDFFARKLIAVSCAVAAALCIGSIGVARGRAAARQEAAAGLKTAVPQQSAPFRAGEQLNYRVEWAAASNAASVALTIPERRNLYGWATWHFRAAVHTVGGLRSMFEIDDQFDSYADVATFETRQFEEYLSELGRKHNEVMHFVANGEQAKGPGPTVVVLPGTHDPLDALYDLRTIDWNRTPEFRAPVYDGKNMYEMSARREDANEPVRVAAGQFSTSRISIQLFQYRRLVAGIHFEIWLADNGERAPVVMRADLPFGTIRAELISVEK
jgi:hypothetical protein